MDKVQKKKVQEFWTSINENCYMAYDKKPCHMLDHSDQERSQKLRLGGLKVIHFKKSGNKVKFKKYRMAIQRKIEKKIHILFWTRKYNGQ